MRAVQFQYVRVYQATRRNTPEFWVLQQPCCEIHMSGMGTGSLAIQFTRKVMMTITDSLLPVTPTCVCFREWVLAVRVDTDIRRESVQCDQLIKWHKAKALFLVSWMNRRTLFTLLFFQKERSQSCACMRVRVGVCVRVWARVFVPLYFNSSTSWLNLRTIVWMSCYQRIPSAEHWFSVICNNKMEVPTCEMSYCVKR